MNHQMFREFALQIRNARRASVNAPAASHVEQCGNILTSGCVLALDEQRNVPPLVALTGCVCQASYVSGISNLLRGKFSKSLVATILRASSI